MFAVVLTFILWNWEARELLVLPAQNEVHGTWMELTDPWTEFPNLLSVVAFAFQKQNQRL